MTYDLTAWATLAVLATYFWTATRAGLARAKYQVLAPSMDGPPEFLRSQRVHMNTLEQLPLLLLPMWLCAIYFGDRWAAAGALLWCVARVVYALAYYKNPTQRSVGFALGMLACVLLMLGAIIGLLMR